MAELFGRADGCAHGRGGSMHLLDVDRGFYGGWGIVAGQLPVATGLALALVRRGKEQAVVCELGDGAVNMGAWHESLNLAALWNLPIVFLVVNNGYGMGTSVARASAEPELYRRASAFRMHGERVDGDDLEAVVEASDRLLKRAREEREPAVLEVVDLPLPRPLGRRRRPRLPHQGRDRRASRPTTRSPACARTLREHGCTDDELDASTARSTSASRPPSPSPTPAPSPTWASSRATSTRPAAAASSRACGRAARSARRSSCSTGAWAHERRRRAADHRHPADDLPRGAAARDARGARPRRARLRDGRGGRRLRGLLQGHRRPDERVRPRADPRHADLRGGLRRRRGRRRDGRRAPDRRDHDDQLPARRDRPGRQPRGQGADDVRRRGRLPDGHPHAERRRQPAHRPALAVARGAGSRTRPA